MRWKLHRAAVGLLRGQESGHSDIPDRDASCDVNYGEYEGLESRSEPEMIEAETAETDRSDYPLDRSGDRIGTHVILLIHDEHDREIVIADGSRREIDIIINRLDMITVKGGHKAYQKEIRKLREEYLSKRGYDEE